MQAHVSLTETPQYREIHVVAHVDMLLGFGIRSGSLRVRMNSEEDNWYTKMFLQVAK